MTADEVESELRRVLPVEWTLSRSRLDADEWTVSPPQDADRGGIRRSFGILLKGDVVVVTHGNNDVGPYFRLAERGTLVRTAVFVDDEWAALRGDARLGDELWTIMQENQPNAWGYT